MKTLPSLIAVLAFATTLHARIWTTTENRTFEADYVSATATQVTVKLKDGRNAAIDLSRLAQADRDFVAQQSVAPGAAPAAPAAPDKPAAPAPPAKPAAPAPFGAHAIGAPAAFKGPYAEDITGDWKQFEGKGGLQCMFFGSPTLDASKKWPLLVYLHGKGNNLLTSANLSFAAACAKP